MAVRDATDSSAAAAARESSSNVEERPPLAPPTSQNTSSTSRAATGQFAEIPKRSSSAQVRNEGADTSGRQASGQASGTVKRRRAKLPDSEPGQELAVIRGGGGVGGGDGPSSTGAALVLHTGAQVSMVHALQVEADRVAAQTAQAAMFAKDAETIYHLPVVGWKFNIPDAAANRAIQSQGLFLAMLSTFGFNLNNNWAMRAVAEPMKEFLSQHMPRPAAAFLAFSLGGISGGTMAGYAAAFMSAIGGSVAMGAWQKAFGPHELSKRDVELAIPPASAFVPGTGNTVTKTEAAYELDVRMVEVAREKMAHKQTGRMLNKWTTHMTIWLSFSAFNTARMAVKPDPKAWEDAAGVILGTLPAAWIAMAVVTHMQWTDTVKVEDQNGAQRDLRINEVKLIDPKDQTIYQARYSRGFDGFFHKRRGMEAAVYFAKEGFSLGVSVMKANAMMPALQAGLASVEVVLAAATAADIPGARTALISAKSTLITANYAFALWPLLVEFVEKALARGPAKAADGPPEDAEAVGEAADALVQGMPGAFPEDGDGGGDAAATAGASTSAAATATASASAAAAATETETATATATAPANIKGDDIV